jgi:hypothetical protein
LSSNYREIVIPDVSFETIAKAAESGGSNEILRIFYTLNSIHKTVGELHGRVLDHPEVSALLTDPGTKFDLTFVFPLFNEVGYYLGHRFNSSVVLYMSTVANSILSLQMGYQDNPSFVTSSMHMGTQWDTPRKFCETET